MNSLDKNKKVEVYFNLHKKCWSVRQAGKPVVHTAVSYTHLTLPTPPYV